MPRNDMRSLTQRMASAFGYVGISRIQNFDFALHVLRGAHQQLIVFTQLHSFYKKLLAEFVYLHLAK